MEQRAQLAQSHNNNARVSQDHELVLAPSLAPFGNASEHDGANQLEPSRGSCPAPQMAELRPPHDASAPITDDITRAQLKADRARGLVAPQPQPAVNTKAMEATSGSLGRTDAEKATVDREENVDRAREQQPSLERVMQRNRNIRGSIYTDDVDDLTRRGKHEVQPASGRGEERQLRGSASGRLQSTNEGNGGAVGEGFKLPADFDDDDEDLAEGSMPRDAEDPDAIYRMTTNQSATFKNQVDMPTRLSKEERRAEKKDLKARKRQKLVRDPVTGQDIWIENARGSSKKVMAQDGVIVPEQRSQQQQTEKSAAQIVSQLHKVPFKDDKTNLLYFPMLPPEWKVLLEESQRSLFQWGYVMVFVVITVQVVMSLFPPRYSIWLNAICALGSIVFVKNRVASTFADAFHEAERVRGEHATINAIPESVEWLNNIVRTIWPTINPELFAAPVDLLEDVMQKQVPSVVHTVKVSDFDIGSIPFRILSMRYLPDDGLHRGEGESAGEYVNLEVAFGYRAGKTDKSIKSKAKNIHLLIWFLVGLRNVLGIPLPVWVQVQGILGKARVRVQLVPDPPFLKNGTISMLGMPKIELSTFPISTRFINVMYLPFVSQLVSFAIKTVIKDFIAPRSYTLDISRLIVGDDVKKETASIGVLMIAIHGATQVPKADHRPGRSKVDPYVTVQYSRYGKTRYSTRVIHQDFNPVWEETCFLPILPAAIKAEEKIRLNLWDSDRITADDLLGRVEVSLTNLVMNPGVFERRIDKVVGTSGTKLHWSIGFFGKKDIPDQDVPELVDLRIPPRLRDDPSFKEPEPLWSIDSKVEKLVCRTPPEKDYPGILSIQIHQIDDLGVVKSRSKLHNRQGRVLDAEAVEQGKEDDSSSAPSSYCNVSLNDELVYKTRTRAYTNRPIFNASFERFVRSFSDVRLRVTVRDQRFRENDPIIGILPLVLSKELEMQGQVTRWYPLCEGIGYGNIKVSLLFRCIDCQIPRTLQGWNVGTLQIYSIRARVGDVDAEALQDCSLRIDTMLGHKTIGAVHAQRDPDGLVHWDLGGTLTMPIRRRHATSLNLEAHRGGVPFTKKGLFSGIYGASVVALSSLDDDLRDVVSIPVFQTDDYVRFKQNSLAQEGHAQDATLRKLGCFEVDCLLTSGLSDAHRRFVKRSEDLAQTHEAWETERVYRRRLAYDAKQERKEASVRSKRTVKEDITTTGQDGDGTSPLRFTGFDRAVQFVNDSNHTDDDGSVSETMNDTHRDVTLPNDDEDDVRDWISDSSSIRTTTSRRSLKAWLSDKQAERRERHRRHRGVMQQKPARTAHWLKDGLRRGISRASRAMTLNREDDLVEREV